MSPIFKREIAEYINLEFGARYKVLKAYKGLPLGRVVRLCGGSKGKGNIPVIYSFRIEDTELINIPIEPEIDSEKLPSCLERMDFYEVRGSVFEYQSPNGKLIRKFDGEIHAVFFGFGRIYLTESKEGLPSNLHCMDYHLQDLWMHPGQGNNDPYDSIIAKDGVLRISSWMMVAEFEPYTGAWVWGSLNK